MIFYVQTPFMIIIHMSVHLGLLSITIISHIRYSSIFIFIGVNLVIFHNGALIVLGSNTINKTSMSPRCCRHGTPSHKRAMIVASLLWLAFVDKRRGVQSVSDVEPFRRGVLSASFFLGHQDRLVFHTIIFLPT